MSIAAKFPLASAFLGMVDYPSDVRGRYFLEDVRRIQRHRSRLGIPSLKDSLK